MANPNVPQGTLNRLRGSVTVPSNTQLNVTAPYLGKDGISLSFDGAANTAIDTMVGLVQSPEPYQRVTMAIHLLKTQALAELWKSTVESNVLLGDITVKTDSSILAPYLISNCAVMNVNPLKFDGTDAGWIVMITGIYYINSDLWNL
jgi:hypothetical protein